jgi:hypothetical protein
VAASTFAFAGLASDDAAEAAGVDGSDDAVGSGATP